MASQLPSQTLKRARIPSPSCCAKVQIQQRNASFLKRPHRPYTFTQLVTLSDGSTYLSRTTSPLPVYKSLKDTRNHPMWQPSLDSLRNVEQDEAGRLRAFRQKFGRGWDLDAEGEGAEAGEGAKAEEQSLIDLIASAGGDTFLETKSASGRRATLLGEEKAPTKIVTTRGPDGKLIKVEVEIKEKELLKMAEKGTRKP